VCLQASVYRVSRRVCRIIFGSISTPTGPGRITCSMSSDPSTTTALSGQIK
jgi:hypothetical protein